MGRAKLTWQSREYRNPLVLLENRTEAEMRKEYSRLRSIARKRLERIKGTEFERTQSYKYAKNQFIPLSEIPNARVLAYKLKDVADFVESPKTTLSGMKKIRSLSIKRLKEHGIDFITNENYVDFGNFMEFAKAKMVGQMFDSDRAVAIYEWSTAKNIDVAKLKQSFDEWYDAAYHLEEFNPRGAKTMSSKELRRAIAGFNRDFLE